MESRGYHYHAITITTHTILMLKPLPVGWHTDDTPAA
jgi:hypothetical protein